MTSLELAMRAHCSLPDWGWVHTPPDGAFPIRTVVYPGEVRVLYLLLSGCPPRKAYMLQVAGYSGWLESLGGRCAAYALL